MISAWFNSLIKPSETFTNELPNASLGKGTLNFLIAGLIIGVAYFLAYSLFFGLTGFSSLGVLIIIVAPIALIISSLIGTALYFIISKLVGGKGSYTGLYYLTSLYAVPIIVLALIPIVNIISGLYSIFLSIRAVQISQSLSFWRSVAVILLPVVLLVFVWVVW